MQRFLAKNTNVLQANATFFEETQYFCERTQMFYERMENFLENTIPLQEKVKAFQFFSITIKRLHQVVYHISVEKNE